MNAKLAKLLRRKAKEESWTPEQIKEITKVIAGLGAEGRAVVKRVLMRAPQDRIWKEVKGSTHMSVVPAIMRLTWKRRCPSTDLKNTLAKSVALS